MWMSYVRKQLPMVLRETTIPTTDKFIPKHFPAQTDDISSLATFVTSSQNILVLTGAGISTESGIPDYRSEAVGLYARSNHRPVQYRDFLNSAKVRQSYWARNYVGWPRFSQVKPNITHHLLQLLETIGKVSCVVTQNVDSLHSKAGSQNVVELHGTAFRVICLNCGASYDRYYIQEILNRLNPEMHESSTMIRPDGDVDISPEKVVTFKPPLCEQCEEGVLKPDITFFGDNVPKALVDCVKQNVSSCDSLLVLGSSLSVFSGYRIILQAHEEKKNIAVVNIGPTRGDKLADLKISGRCSDVLLKIFES